MSEYGKLCSNESWKWGTNMKLRFLLLIIYIACMTAACSKPIDEAAVTKDVSTEDFLLEVSTPTNGKAHKEFEVTAKLTYTGNEERQLEYSGNKVLFYLYDDHNYLVNEVLIPEIMNLEAVRPMDTDEFQERFTLPKGSYSLVVRTASLTLDGSAIKGTGNATYTKHPMSNNQLQLEESKISLDPIEIHIH